MFASDTAGDGEILSQTIELYVVFDAVTPVGNLIFGITGSYEYSESSENVPYQSIDTYTENSLYVLDGLTAGLKTVEIGFRNADGSMSRSFVSAYWADGMLEAFMAALRSKRRSRCASTSAKNILTRSLSTTSIPRWRK